MPKYHPGSRGKCLHCQTTVRFELPTSNKYHFPVSADNQQINIIVAQCPECKKLIITFLEVQNGDASLPSVSEFIAWPISSSRPPAPSEVPTQIADDYNEAALVLPVSAKASAALSRRCLQAVLSDAGRSQKKYLSDQIDEVLPSLPSFIAENLHAVRIIGNFAAHQQKSKVSGEILGVEPGEAELNLDVLDTLFDFYYVKPEIERKKREKLNAKLEEAGKSPIKKPPNNED